MLPDLPPNLSNGANQKKLEVSSKKLHKNLRFIATYSVKPRV